MNLPQLFNAFANEISNRNGILTEDSLRYIFFACMLRQDPALNNYTLELPYDLLRSANNHYPIFIGPGHNLRPAQTGKVGNELDLYYEDSQLSEYLCVEFKFHRAGMRSSTLNYTASAGAIFNDIKRLQLIQPSANPVHRLLVYVTDDKMHNYLFPKRPKNVYRKKLYDFYNLKPGNNSPFSFNLPSVPAVFVKAASHSFLSSTPPVINVKKLFEDQFPTTCLSFSGQAHIKIYEVFHNLSLDRRNTDSHKYSKNEMINKNYM